MLKFGTIICVPKICMGRILESLKLVQLPLPCVLDCSMVNTRCVTSKLLRLVILDSLKIRYVYDIRTDWVKKESAE